MDEPDYPLEWDGTRPCIVCEKLSPDEICQECRKRIKKILYGGDRDD